jgi:hypothetical protein
VENPQQLWTFVRPMELGLGETIDFELSVGPPSSGPASAFRRAVPNYGMYPTTRTPLDHRNVRGLLPEYWSGGASAAVVTSPSSAYADTVIDLSITTNEDSKGHGIVDGERPIQRLAPGCWRGHQLLSVHDNQ